MLPVGVCPLALALAGCQADRESADGDTGSSGAGEQGFCDPVRDWDPALAARELEVLELVNRRRASGADCGDTGVFEPAPPLAMHEALRCAARVHSHQMATRHFFDHVTPWGETPADRVHASDYEFSLAGENIAVGISTASGTVDAWMASAPHCANIMDPRFVDTGVGYEGSPTNGQLWTQTFARP